MSSIKRAYLGGCVIGKIVDTDLGGTDMDRSFAVSNLSGWDFQPGDIFAVALGRGTALEEKVLCKLASRDATTGKGTLTIYVDGQGHAYRGWDDTPISAHPVDTTVEHIWTATDARESMEIYALSTDPNNPMPPHRHLTWRDIKAPTP